MKKKPRKIISKAAYWRTIGLNQGASKWDLILRTLGLPYNVEGCTYDG